jgi:hypothetical protein
MIIAAAQLDYRLKLGAQLDYYASVCKKESVDVVVLPEMLNMPIVVRGYRYGFGEMRLKQSWWDRLLSWAVNRLPDMPWMGKGESMDEALYRRLVRRFSLSCPTTYVVGGSVVVKRPEGLFNVGVVAKNGEILAEYDKLNPIHFEKLMGIHKGKGGPAKVQMENGQCLHAAICYDIEFVEQWKFQPQEGDLVAVPSWGWRPDGWKETEYDLQFVDTAQELGVALIRCFWAGDMPLGRMGGNSAIIVPGKPILRADKEEGQLIGAEYKKGGGADCKTSLQASNQ